MKTIEFEFTIQSPIAQVFARLVDIDGHDKWMAERGSMLRHPRQRTVTMDALAASFGPPQGSVPG
jgi:uncharacterized protein YndB with AHSA1/START domain